MSAKTIIFGSIAWAVAFIASAFVLKGNSIGDWVEGALLVSWIMFVSCAGWSTSCRRRCGAAK